MQQAIKDAIHSSVAEFAHFNEMQAELARKLAESARRELGQVESLRSSILGLVVEQNYERAKEAMVAYVDIKTAFPQFQDRVRRLLQHCTELMQAIETKRNFPGINSLSLAKQQEIHERVLEHFEDLKRHLQNIEHIEREHKLDDVRSTVWVLRTLCVCVALIAVLGFVLEVSDGTGETFLRVLGAYMDSLANFFVNKIPL